MSSVSVRVPGSTSNCGAGFDTLGLALQIYNTVTLERVEASGAHPVTPADGRAADLVTEVMQTFAARTGRAVPGFTYQITGDVPPARGLGSSVTVLAGVLAGLNHWAGEPMSREDLVSALTAIEGHPDNAAAGVLGGFCVARCGETPAEYAGTVRIEIPSELCFVVVSPVTEIATKASRGVLPTRISHLDAVRSVNSAACLTAALATGEFEKLRGAVGDFLHEPYRLPGITGAREAIDAGVTAGAYTGWLSGSGSSVLGLAPTGNAEAVSAAMSAAFAAVGVESDARLLIADNAGLVVRAGAL
ncbi:homoserine kinase [Synoicihabitans lomoniglobus]|uniref:Homoserine kinase n=1 Tax=Synoicihabitans lomoniglobus TaxID=2909285 RepID=A0AAF0I455_9BACT|nr:homoserine kinase [Opitutaceae bacterium LMO-M01]WED66300.1 homoserine kinase [Opitutaceae bacterium LMO-M01]